MKADFPIKRIAFHALGCGLALVSFAVGFYSFGKSPPGSVVPNQLTARSRRSEESGIDRYSVALNAVNQYLEVRACNQSRHIALLLQVSQQSVIGQLNSIEFESDIERFYFLLYFLSRSSSDLAFITQSDLMTAPFTKIEEVFSVSVCRAVRQRSLTAGYHDSNYLTSLFKSLDTRTMCFLLASLLTLNDGSPEALAIELQVCALLKIAPGSFKDELIAFMTSTKESLSYLYSLSKSGRELANCMCGYGRFPIETQSHAVYNLQFAEIDSLPPLHLVSSPNQFGDAFIGWAHNIPLPEPVDYDFSWIRSLPEEFRASAVRELLKRVGRVDPAGAFELNSRIAADLGIEGNIYATVKDLIRLDPYEASGIISKLPPGSQHQRLVGLLLEQKDLSEAERLAWTEFLKESATPARSP